MNRLGSYCLLGAFALAVLFATSPWAEAQKRKARVFVGSEASPEYLEKKDSEDGPVRETYHFMEGRYFGGIGGDSSLKEVGFKGVIGTLSEYLTARNYHLARSAEEGDLLIIVHYGVTGVESDLDELFLMGEFGDDAYADTELDEDGQEVETAAGNIETGDRDGFDRDTRYQGVTSHSRLLGFDKALNKRNLLEQEEFDLRAELEDDRYFMILMAYDWQRVRAEKAFHLMWTTRFSVNALGTNFEEANHTLSRAAMGYFGTNLDGLAKTVTFHGEGKIERGELEVLGTEKSETEKEKSE